MTGLVIWATMADVAEQNNVKHFVLISTDKAVDPTSVMGASKRLAEMMVQSASEYLGDAPAVRRISKIGYRDVEQCLWHNGFEDVYRKAARISPRPDRRGPPPHRIIQKAVRKRSKPYLALAVAEAAAERGRRSIPDVLRNVIETSVALARSASVT